MTAPAMRISWLLKRTVNANFTAVGKVFFPASAAEAEADGDDDDDERAATPPLLDETH